MNTAQPMPIGPSPQPLLGLSARTGALKSAIDAGLVGCSALVERLLIALLTGGHVLIEGAPGLAKTRAVKRLAAGLDASFARVQCTPDLLPSDITGTPVWRPDRGVFEFVAGPVFHSLVLVDEINRAPPKVQSALLEAMAEQQVTAGGVTRELPNPFMVVATQNPIEHEGTFPLPEAQLDRFLLHVVVALPAAPVERQILDMVEREMVEHGTRVPNRLSIAEIQAARDAVARIHLAPAMKDYIVRIVTAPRNENFAPDIRKSIAHPPSPRGTISLALATKARAYIAGRDTVSLDDVTELAADCLAHRTVLSWQAAADGETARGLIERILDRVQPL